MAVRGQILDLPADLVETGPVDEAWAAPAHPRTDTLLEAVPALEGLL